MNNDNKICVEHLCFALPLLFSFGSAVCQLPRLQHFAATRLADDFQPPGWQMTSSHPTADAVAFEFNPKADSAETPSFNVNMLPEGASLTLEGLKPGLIAIFKKKHPGIVVRSQTFSSLGGVRDLDLVLTLPENGIPIRVHQIYVLKNGMIYLFTIAYLEKSHAQYDAPISQMRASFRWNS